MSPPAKILGYLALAVLAACASTSRAPQPTAKAPTDLVFPGPPEQPRFVYERTLVGSTDLSIIDRATRWRQLLTGERESGTNLAKPFDVAVCKGIIFVSDTVRRTVMVFDVPNHKFFEIGRDEPGALRKPLGMDTDDACNLYVADGTMQLVSVYTKEGEFVRAIGGVDWFERLSHVAVDPAGTQLFAVDTGGVGSEHHRIRVFDAASGEHRFDIGTRGSENGQFNLPRDIEFGGHGLLYVVDGGNFRVAVLNRDGTFVRNVGTIGRRYGQFARPKGVAVDHDGNIYVSDTAHGNFQIFDGEGQLLLFIGTRGEKFDRATYMLPAGIAIDEDGRVLIADQFFRKVDIFRPFGLTETQGYLGGWDTATASTD